MPDPVREGLDYPVAQMDGVEPIFVRAMILQAMQARYQSAVPDLSDEEARDCVKATWETDWPDDPEPRTMEAALQCVDDDLSYWEED